MFSLVHIISVIWIIYHNSHQVDKFLYCCCLVYLKMFSNFSMLVYLFVELQYILCFIPDTSATEKVRTSNSIKRMSSKSVSSSILNLLYLNCTIPQIPNSNITLAFVEKFCNILCLIKLVFCWSWFQMNKLVSANLILCKCFWLKNPFYHNADHCL